MQNFEFGLSFKSPYVQLTVDGSHNYVPGICRYKKGSFMNWLKSFFNPFFTNGNSLEFKAVKYKWFEYLTNILLGMRKTGLQYAFLALLGFLSACGTTSQISEQASAVSDAVKSQDYLIGPGDRLRVFVWGNTDLSTEVSVRPDGKISTPLVEDVVASGKTPAQLAREMESQLVRYIKSPVVTVMVQEFNGTFGQQIRIIGEAAQPRSIPYRENITLLDVMIAVGGLTEFASGNDASVVRTTNEKQSQFKVRLDDLVKLGDITANIQMQPGDILIIPESWF